MTRRAWMMALVGLGLIVVNASGLGAARPSDAGSALSDVDAELTRLLGEMGGSELGCPPCPPGTNCCTAVCIISCCTVVCPPGSVPNCSCNFQQGSAHCFCVLRSEPCEGGTGSIVSQLQECIKELVEIVEASLPRP